MARALTVGRRVRHRKSGRVGIVVSRRTVQFGYGRYMVRWDGNDHASGEYGIREFQARAAGGGDT